MTICLELENNNMKKNVRCHIQKPIMAMNCDLTISNASQRLLKCILCH